MGMPHHGVDGRMADAARRCVKMDAKLRKAGPREVFKVAHAGNRATTQLLLAQEAVARRDEAVEWREGARVREEQFRSGRVAARKVAERMRCTESGLAREAVEGRVPSGATYSGMLGRLQSFSTAAQVRRWRVAAGDCGVRSGRCGVRWRLQNCCGSD